MGPMGNIHAVQIHPTRRCNLRCLHCYSSSSPSATEALHIDTLRTALDDLAEENYNWASFSGGEPLVYTPLPTALAHAKRVGMNTAVVSNGMLLTPRRLDLIEEHTDLLVISLDGKPRSHNRIRNSDKAFDTMAAKLPELQARGIRFGFLFTLTQHNLDELPWVIEFAVNVGARLVQIHPLEYFGNATTQLAGSAPDAIEGAHAWLIAEKLKQTLAGQMALQVDLVHTNALQQQPESFFLDNLEGRRDTRLGSLLSPLVIEPDGEVLPLEYGFPRNYSLGNLGRQRIPDMAATWRSGLGRRFHALCKGLHESLTRSGEAKFFNWYEQIATAAGQEQLRRSASSRKTFSIPVVAETARPAAPRVV